MMSQDDGGVGAGRLTLGDNFLKNVNNDIQGGEKARFSHQPATTKHRPMLNIFAKKVKTHIVHSAQQDKLSGRGSHKNKTDAEQLFADGAFDKRNLLSDRGLKTGNFASIAAAATLEVNRVGIGGAGRKKPTIRGVEIQEEMKIG